MRGRGGEKKEVRKLRASLSIHPFVIRSPVDIDREIYNRIIIPIKIPLRLITTSTDVIHSWTVPSLGIKVDAVPGRINQLNLISKRPGIFFGQCSEICGINHRFIPIIVESTSFQYFFKFLKLINKFKKLVNLI